MKPLIVTFDRDDEMTIERFDVFELQSIPSVTPDPDAVRNMGTLLFSRDFSGDSREPKAERVSHALVRALSAYSIDVTFVAPMRAEKREQPDQLIDVFSDHDFKRQFMVIAPPKDIHKPDPETSPDFYDLLRELDNALANLSEHLRRINDPKIFDAQLKMTNASINSLRCYIDIDNPNSPEKIPGEAAVSVLDRLKNFELLKISEQANKWVLTIVKILEALRKGDG